MMVPRKPGPGLKTSPLFLYKFECRAPPGVWVGWGNLGEGVLLEVRWNPVKVCCCSGKVGHTVRLRLTNPPTLPNPGQFSPLPFQPYPPSFRHGRLAILPSSCRERMHQKFESGCGGICVAVIGSYESRRRRVFREDGDGTCTAFFDYK